MSLKYMAKNLGVELAKQLKKLSPLHLFVLVVVVMFILYDTSLPADIEDFVQQPFGKFVLLVIVLGSFAGFGVVVGFLVMIAAYELLRRAGETHQGKITSKLLSEEIELHDSQSSHGSEVFSNLSLQFKLFAKSLAVVVLPTPLTPVKIYE